jgi:steroid delta-isomerase-like uncharacterized protein
MDAETVVRNWIDAYNRSDWDLDLALLAPNAVTEVVAREERSTDPVESQNGARAFKAAFPDLRVEIENLVVAEPFVVVEWRASGTNTGTFADQPPTGKRFTRRGVGVAEVHDGRITAYRDYFDRATLLSQIGRMDLI